jgi:hypothetical protein
MRAEKHNEARKARLHLAWSEGRASLVINRDSWNLFF